MTATKHASANTLESRFIGCLLGGAIGDALGFTTENMSPARIQRRFGRVTNYHVTPTAGHYTDDTQLTIALAETLLACQGFDRDHFRRQLAHWWLVPPRLSGRSTKNAALKCLLGFQETGRHVPGSSGAMRAAPLALFYAHDPATLRTQTIAACQVTHTHPSAIAGALVSTFSIHYCLTHTSFDQTEYLHTIAAAAREFDSSLSDRMLALPDLLEQDDAQATQTLLHQSGLLGSPIDDIMLTAIYAFIKYPHDFERSTLLCVNAGWDTDTMAAIHANTAGAWHGLQGIPPRWVANLENGYKGRDYIIDLARRLAQQAGPPPPLPLPQDYAADLWRNTRFIFHMLTKKPKW